MYSISEFAEKVGLSVSSIRNYIRQGLLEPIRTPGGRFRFTDEHVQQVLRGFEHTKHSIPKVVIYGRVSTADQKAFLEDQIQLLEHFVAEQGWSIDKVFKDVASSFNFKRKGLRSMLGYVKKNHIDKVVIYSRDRLSRIAFDLFEWLFQEIGAELIVFNTSEYTNDIQKEDLVEELISFIHYITSKLYGLRRYKNKLDNTLREVLAEYVTDDRDRTQE